MKGDRWGRRQCSTRLPSVRCNLMEREGASYSVEELKQKEIEATAKQSVENLSGLPNKMTCLKRMVHLKMGKIYI